MDELTDFEKLIESVNQLAKAVIAYHDALRQGEFSEEDALVLTLDYQQFILSMANSKKDDK